MNLSLTGIVFRHLLDYQVDCRKFVEQGCLSFAVASLSSRDVHVRQAGYHVLSRYMMHLEGARFKERKQVTVLNRPLYISNQTNRHTDRQTEGQRQRDRHTDTQTGRQVGKQTDSQGGRETDIIYGLYFRELLNKKVQLFRVLSI